MQYNISSYSTALFSTWIFIDELALLFDCGDGVNASLTQKSRKVKHLFISHPDRDHLAGLFQFNQLNAREGYPNIYYPKDSGSFPAIKNFVSKFDPQSKGSNWEGLKDRQQISIGKNIFVEAIRNEHIVTDDNLDKSFSYKVFESKRKLKGSYKGLSGKEIEKLMKEQGREALTDLINTNIIGFSGDTTIEDPNRWDNCKVLIHEATFLEDSDEIKDKGKAFKHCRLSEVIEMVSNTNIEVLILSHFSTRYSENQIREAVEQQCEKYQIKIPVYCIFPGRVHRDILNSDQPVYSP